jgi:hypothetical protein
MQTSHDERLRGQFMAQQRMVLDPGRGLDGWAIAVYRGPVFGDPVGGGANLGQHFKAGSILNDIVAVDGLPELATSFAKG